MSGWEKFLDTFFKWELIERYFPSIMYGMLVTVELAAAVRTVASGGSAIAPDVAARLAMA